ncbi:hypothetical protein HLV35_03075 [Eggerthellaceae bacterium zg-997]|nr:hypothetical protein [Eggerthellaceae bacterium zg-997]
MDKPDEPREQNDEREDAPAPDIDWKAEARKWERRAKENAERARERDDAAGARDAELQDARARAERAEGELESLRESAARDAARAAVAAETGVPAELIAGDDEEAMRAHAERLIRFARPAAPRAPRPGTFSGDAAPADDEAKRQLARQLFGGGQ